MNTFCLRSCENTSCQYTGALCSLLVIWELPWRTVEEEHCHESLANRVPRSSLVVEHRTQLGQGSKFAMIHLSGEEEEGENWMI
jgi:hypothetical protein